eukprot:5742039-Karenia_brevis.AAC.1
MVAEQTNPDEGLPVQPSQGSGQTVDVDVDDKVIKMVSLTVKQEPKKTVDGDKKGKLEEKYFRRIDKFTGEINQFRTWMFNIKVSLGQIDSRLAEE